MRRIDLHHQFRDREFWKSVALLTLGFFIVFIVFFKFVLYVVALFCGLFLINAGLRIQGRPSISVYARQFVNSLWQQFQ